MSKKPKKNITKKQKSNNKNKKGNPAFCGSDFEDSDLNVSGIKS